MYSDLSTLCVVPETSIHQAIAQMEVSRVGIVLVVDADRKLLGTITDGDVRRAVLGNVNFEQPVSVLLAAKAGSRFARPITLPQEADRNTILQTLQRNNISHLPMVDEDQRVVALATRDEFIPGGASPLEAVIMAGGQGARLSPLTDELPKPMLPLGNRPLMERILQQLRDAGITHANVTVHHKSEKITEYFRDGREFGIDISYVTEDSPLGTAGALGLMGPPQDTVLVINGDILTQADFRAMLTYHREHGADLTLAVLRREVEVPYGVIECDGNIVRGLTEKPQINLLINAGIYLLEPDVYRFIPSGKLYHMTDLIRTVVDSGQRVVAFPIREYWMDIGDQSNYERAQEDVKTWTS